VATDGAVAPAPSGEGPIVAPVARDENGTDVPPGVADAPPDLRCQADAALPERVDYAQPGPYGVATLEVTFEDESRPILATDTHSPAPSRRLVTTIHYPTSGQAPPFGPAPVASGGPFPLLMYSHGYSSSRNEGVPVATRATSYGYMVVVPEFPLTNILANGGSPDVTDAANQPGDVSFLIDRVLALSLDSSHPLANSVDETRIGALGVSLGGLTTLLLSFHPRFRDERIKAAAPIAPLSSFFAEGFYHTRSLPLLLLHGDMDAFIDYERNARRAFERAAPNARLITVANGTHAAFGAQLDPTTLALLNALLGAPNAHPSNPDGVGCGAVGATLSMTGPNFLEALGGAADFIAPDDTELRPCQGDEYTRPALDSSEQEDIAVRSVVAFFDAHLANTPETREGGCRYLLHELPKTPSVTLE
jgi:predicted dienelactone hydrolase